MCHVHFSVFLPCYSQTASCTSHLCAAAGLLSGDADNLLVLVLLIACLHQMLLLLQIPQVRHHISNPGEITNMLSMFHHNQGLLTRSASATLQGILCCNVIGISTDCLEWSQCTHGPAEKTHKAYLFFVIHQVVGMLPNRFLIFWKGAGLAGLLNSPSQLSARCQC